MESVKLPSTWKPPLPSGMMGGPCEETHFVSEGANELVDVVRVTEDLSAESLIDPTKGCVEQSNSGRVGWPRLGEMLDVTGLTATKCKDATSHGSEE